MKKNSIVWRITDRLADIVDQGTDFLEQHDGLVIGFGVLVFLSLIVFCGYAIHEELVIAKLQPGVAVAGQKADLEKVPLCEALEKMICRHEAAIAEVRGHRNASVDYGNAYVQLRDQARACAASSASTAERR